VLLLLLQLQASSSPSTNFNLANPPPLQLLQGVQHSQQPAHCENGRGVMGE
jgi:hypothetical protein